ncbi:MAG: hypothetical protein GY794_21885 [bacterium]|nr:hypothetical protein [bacterium]
MAKKKNSMALFEVISKNRDKNPDSEVIVPDWVKPGGQQAPTGAQPPEVPAQSPVVPVEVVAPISEPEPIPVLEPAAEAIPEPEPQSPAPLLEEVAPTEEIPVLQTTSTWGPRQTSESPEVSDLPIWSTVGGRLILSLNYVSCLVASTGVLLLILAAFWIGRSTAPDSTPVAQNSKNAIKRIPGKYYMALQIFPDDSDASWAEARRMAAFCNANGDGEQADVQTIYASKRVDGRIVRGKKYLIVWSATPFNSQTSEEVTAHALFIQNGLGVKYAQKYRSSKYKFIQPQRSGKLIPKMYIYKKSVQKTSGQ